jgi:poly-beta-1,6-N-acetyl-D-glucosamine synthase
MNRLHLYILLYGFLIFMMIDTVLFGFSFATSNPFYVVTNVVMTLFVCTWLLRALPLLVVSSFYRPYVARMKARARVARGGIPYTPLVSVIIPAYNEQVGIVPTLKTLLASTYRSVEILVIDDGSTDETENRVLAFLRKYRREYKGGVQPIQVRYFRKQNGGKGSSLNHGISKAKGEIICTFDADCVVAKDCIERFVSCFIDPSIMACAGNIKIANRRATIGMVQYLEYLMAFRLKQAEAMLGIVLVLGGAASAFRKSVFDVVGDYDTSLLTEDMELTFRIQRAGMRVFYAHEAVVYTEGPSTWKGLRKQRMRWKRGRIETMYIYRDTFFSRTVTNRVFFWLVLPMVLLQDVEFLLCSVFTILVYFFCFTAFNFLPILATVLLSSSLYSLQLIQDRDDVSWSSLSSIPLSWFLFHLSVVVEVYSLVVAYITFWTKRQVVWQKWQRQGVIERR